MLPFAHKWLKQSCADARRDTYAIVDHVYYHVPGIHADVNFDACVGACFARRLASIQDQVVNGALYLLRIDEGARLFRLIHMQSECNTGGIGMWMNHMQ